MANRTPVHRAAELGQSIWYDNLRRGLLRSGELAHLVEQGVSGVTSNPTIFEKAIAGSTDYDEALARLVAESRSVGEIYDDLVIEDIRAACDLLRPVYDASGRVDGRVSVEVRPELAHDGDATVAEALRLHKAIGRDNVMIKIPATAAGLPAVRQVIARGVSVNVTLIFSVRQYRAVAEAYLAGLEDRRAAGGALGYVGSVASFFVSRIDSAVDRLLRARARGDDPAAAVAAESLLGTIAIANAQHAYRAYRELIASPRWAALAAAGARPQRLLWASTGVKDPGYRDTLYADELCGPDTVDTLPPAALAAFLDHGKPRDALGAGARQADDQLAWLARIGIDLDQVCDQLLDEGVRAFADSMAGLTRVIAARREALLERTHERWRTRGGAAAAATDGALAELAARRTVERIWAREPAAFLADPAHERGIRARLGWLDAPERMEGVLADLRDLADEARGAGLTDAVLLGMGGSSLCPEVLAESYGATPGWLRLHVLDNTDPAAVAAVERSVDLGRTLFVVASKSGGTIEVRAFARHFRERVRAGLGDRAGERFVAITDPGTPLAEQARADGYRRVFLNPEDIGGRYSAISYFGLVPAALLGVDLDALVGDAARMAVGCAACVPAADNPGANLGAFLGGCARAGRDKLTLLASRPIAAFGAWAEQLVAESLGKLGKGIVPVDLEPPGAPARYGADRCFAVLRFAADPALDERAAALEAAGFPVARMTLLSRADLGGEFFRWEFATAVAGALLEVDPFDEPNVTEAKQATAACLDEFARAGRLPEAPAVAPDDPRVIEHLRGARPGDYLALCAYLVRDAARDAAFADLRARLRDATGCATTLGYGPRFLHSTGQLHKGGPDTGVFLQLVADAPADLPIPGERYSFATLRDAQALGDLQVLRRRGRRVLRVHLGADADAGLARLGAAVAAAFSAPGDGR